MKKIISFASVLIMLIICVILISPNKVSAIYNGGSVPPGSGPGGSCPSTCGKYCGYNNGNHETVRISLRYYTGSGSNYTEEGSVIATNNLWGIKALMSNTSGIIEDANISHNSASLMAYFGVGSSGECNKTTSNANFDKYLGYMGVDKSKLPTKESDPAPGGKKGWRFVIEPIFTAYECGTHVFLGSPKELAIKGLTNKANWNTGRSYSNRLYLQYADVGIRAANASGTQNEAEIADVTSGWGYNIIDVSCYLPKSTCKEEKAKLTKGSTEYNKLINDTAWEINNNPNATAGDIECFTCQEYIDRWGESNSVVQALKTGGKINWSTCGGPKTCAEFKTKNPNPTYAQMLNANITWPGCYTCDNNSDFKSNTPSCNGGSSCSYSLNTSIPNNCTVKQDGYVKDITNWKCIFDSTKQSDANIKSHFVQTDMSSNRLCDVYCREDVEYKYPNAGLTVLAGQYFTLGNSGYYPELKPIEFKATTNCRTTSTGAEGQIDLEKFKSLWDTYDKAVNTTWDAYQKAQANLKAAQSAKGTAISGTCSCYAPPGGTCTPPTWSGTSYSGTATYGVYSGSASWSVISGCRSASRPDYEGRVTSAYSAYKTALKKREDLLIELHQCNNFQYTNRKFKPVVKFKYEEAIYGGKDYTLKEKIKKLESSSKYFSSGTALSSASSGGGGYSWSTGGYENSSTDINKGDNNIRGASTTRHKYECDREGSKCLDRTQQHENNKWVEQTTIKEYEYTLPAGVYEYISKPSGLSVNTQSEALKYSSQYYKLGFSNLPVHYSRQEGKYDYEFNIVSFGKNENPSTAPTHKFNKHIINNIPFGSTTFTGKTKYECTYNVKQKIMCDPKVECCSPPCKKPTGLNLIYRPISLIDPFPGEKGLGRRPGDNWNYSNLVQMFIKENRGVKDYNIYITRDPMYKITLTPNLIKEIRAYNAKQRSKQETYYDYNPLTGGTGGTKKITGVAGYSDFELDCDSSGVKCKSRFIRSTVGGYDFSKYFSGCGIKGKDSALKCASGEGW